MGEAEPTWYCEKCGSHHAISFTHGTQDCAACKRKDKRIAELEKDKNILRCELGLQDGTIERLREAGNLVVGNAHNFDKKTETIHVFYDQLMQLKAALEGGE